jgi:hypothetical protein
MSGGVIRPQKSGEHQTVIFTFAGPLSKSQAEQWNQEIVKLKAMLEDDEHGKVKLIGITIRGDTTPPKYLPKSKKAKSPKKK